MSVVFLPYVVYDVYMSPRHKHAQSQDDQQAIYISMHRLCPLPSDMLSTPGLPELMRLLRFKVQSPARKHFSRINLFPSHSVTSVPSPRHKEEELTGTHKSTEPTTRTSQ